MKALDFPPLPYKGLSHYTQSDFLIFVGREHDVDCCSHLLSSPGIRVLLIHGDTGCGKSSFLHSGLIPKLDNPISGFEFLKDKDEQSCKIIRSTFSPLTQIGRSVFEYIEDYLKFLCNSQKKQEYDDFSKIINDNKPVEIFQKKCEDESDFLINILQKIARHLPRSLVLIIDQTEEVLTQKHPKSNQNSTMNLYLEKFFDFLEKFVSTPIDVKLILTLRTDYYGKFITHIDKRHYKSDSFFSYCSYFLQEPDDKTLLKIITHPTSKEPINDMGKSPFDHYCFQYDKGVPEHIIKDLKKNVYVGGVLPALQMVCSQLYSQAEEQEKKISNNAFLEINREISAEGRLSLLGPRTIKSFVNQEEENSKINFTILEDSFKGIQMQIDEFFDKIIRDFCEKENIQQQYKIRREITRWKEILVHLTETQRNGTVITCIQEKEFLIKRAKELKTYLSPEKTLKHLCEKEILRTTNMLLTSHTKQDQGSKDNQTLVGYSLTHDTIAQNISNWKMNREQLEQQRKKNWNRVIYFFVLFLFFVGTFELMRYYYKRYNPSQEKIDHFFVLLNNRLNEFSSILSLSKEEKKIQDNQKNLSEFITYSTPFYFFGIQSSQTKSMLITLQATYQGLSLFLKDGAKKNYSSIEEYWDTKFNNILDNLDNELNYKATELRNGKKSSTLNKDSLLRNYLFLQKLRSYRKFIIGTLNYQLYELCEKDKGPACLKRLSVAEINLNESIQMNSALFRAQNNLAIVLMKKYLLIDDEKEKNVLFAKTINLFKESKKLIYGILDHPSIIKNILILDNNFSYSYLIDSQSFWERNDQKKAREQFQKAKAHFNKDYKNDFLITFAKKIEFFQRPSVSWITKAEFDSFELALKKDELNNNPKKKQEAYKRICDTLKQANRQQKEFKTEIFVEKRSFFKYLDTLEKGVYCRLLNCLKWEEKKQPNECRKQNQWKCEKEWKCLFSYMIRRQ